jgi:hypothetical protein
VDVKYVKATDNYIEFWGNGNLEVFNKAHMLGGRHDIAIFNSDGSMAWELWSTAEVDALIETGAIKIFKEYEELPEGLV